MAMKVSGSFDARMAEYNRLLASSASFGGAMPTGSSARPAGKTSSSMCKPGLKSSMPCGLRQPPKPVLPRPLAPSRPNCLPQLQAIFDPQGREEPGEIVQSRTVQPPQRPVLAAGLSAYNREPPLAEPTREVYVPRDGAASLASSPCLAATEPCAAAAPPPAVPPANSFTWADAVASEASATPTTGPLPRSPRSPLVATVADALPVESFRSQVPMPASPACTEKRHARTERRATREALHIHRASTEEIYRSPPRTPSTQRSDRHADRDLDAHRPRVRSIDASLRSSAARASALAEQRASAFAERMSISRRGSNPSPAQRPCPEDDCAEYADRFLAGYDKGRLLGRGACAVVWLAAPQGQRGLVAIKQVAKGSMGKKKSDTEAARKEIFFGSYLFHTGGEPKLPAAQFPGIQHIAKLLDYQETKRDIWLVMEYGGTSLTKMAYEIKGEFLRGERLYRVNHLPMLQAMKQDPAVLGALLRQLLSALCILADHRIVHSDIKPDNILVEEDAQHRLKVRFIDLGSAFTFDCPESLALATPEYMPPEALETCSARGLGGLGSGGTGRLSVGPRGSGQARKVAAPVDPVAKLQQQSQPWSFDMWSLGSIVLELCTGTPLWLSYKCRVADDQRASSAALGLFAVPGRDPEKILQKQSDVLHQRGLHGVLARSHGVPLANGGPGSGQELLSQMLAWDPMDRISPHEALEHPWLNDASSGPHLIV